MALMEGKTVFITGAAGGIGNATARLMLKEGALAVMITDINEEITTRALNALKEDFPGRNIEAAWPNLTSEEEVGSVMRAFTEKYGKLVKFNQKKGFSILLRVTNLPEKAKLEMLTNFLQELLALEDKKS